MIRRDPSPTQAQAPTGDLTTPDTAELILVAGPSGSGKTVFINQFRSGNLPHELRRWLPESSERWPQLGANDCMKRGVGLAGVLPRNWTAPGAVVHYDTAYIHRFGLTSYDEDPISELFHRARRLIVVSIEPKPEVLKAQFSNRHARHRSQKSSSHLFWRDNVRSPLERLRQRIVGNAMRDTEDLYKDPVWLAEGPKPGTGTFALSWPKSPVRRWSISSRALRSTGSRLFASIQAAKLFCAKMNASCQGRSRSVQSRCGILPFIIRRPAQGWS